MLRSDSEDENLLVNTNTGDAGDTSGQSFNVLFGMPWSSSPVTAQVSVMIQNCSVICWRASCHLVGHGEENVIKAGIAAHCTVFESASISSITLFSLPCSWSCPSLPTPSRFHLGWVCKHLSALSQPLLSLISILHNLYVWRCRFCSPVSCPSYAWTHNFIKELLQLHSPRLKPLSWGQQHMLWWCNRHQQIIGFTQMV